MSAPLPEPASSAVLDEARRLGGILQRAARAKRPLVRAADADLAVDLVLAADLLIELASVSAVAGEMATRMEDLIRERAALRSLVERAKETGVDEDWRKEARVALRATGPAGRGPGVAE